jgi:hypothetical protein
VISVTEVNLARGTEGPSRARSEWVVASRERVRSGCGVKVAAKGGRSKRTACQRALILSFLPVNALVNLIAVNRMNLYDSESSD